MYLLHNLVEAETGKPLADHLWVTLGYWAQGLRSGDTIAFDARVSIYANGYSAQCDSVDHPELGWRLQRPTRVKIVEQGPCPTDQVIRFGRHCSTKRPGQADRLPQRAVSGPPASSHEALTTSRFRPWRARCLKRDFFQVQGDMDAMQPSGDLCTPVALLMIAVVLVALAIVSTAIAVAS
jgi:hypothetical protein